MKDLDVVVLDKKEQSAIVKALDAVERSRGALMDALRESVARHNAGSDAGTFKLWSRAVYALTEDKGRQATLRVYCSRIRREFFPPQPSAERPKGKGPSLSAAVDRLQAAIAALVPTVRPDAQAAFGKLLDLIGYKPE